MTWRRMGCRNAAPLIHNLDTESRWVVSITPQVLYPLVRSVLYPLNRKLDGSQRFCGRFGQDTKFLALAGRRKSSSSVFQPKVHSR